MITRVQALYYKGFKYIDVNLRTFLLLIGPNGSGKSAFFDIFTFLRDMLEQGPIYAVQRRSSQFMELVWNHQQNWFELAVEFFIPDDMSYKFHTARYEISLTRDRNSGIIIKNENLWLLKEVEDIIDRYSKRHYRYFSFPEEPEPPHSIFVPQNEIRKGWHRVISRNPQGNNYFHSENTGWNMTFQYDPSRASLTCIPEDEERFPITLWVKNLLTRGIQLIHLNGMSMRWPCRPDNPVTFHVEGDNLPIVLKHLKENHPENFNHWLEHVRSTLPDIEQIGVHERAEDRFLYLYVKHSNNLKTPSWLLSDGTLRFLAQTLIAYLPKGDQIYMIEGPENGLHPWVIKSAYTALSSECKNQIFLATHSPEIIRQTEPKNLLCFSKTENGTIDIVNGDEHPRLKDWKRGIDLATLYAAGVLQ